MEATPESPPAAVPARVPVVLLVAVLAVSSSGVLVRSAHAEPLAIAFWRTAIVATLLAPTAGRVTWRDARLVALSGACLAAHFATWFASLGHVSVMRATVLVCLGPLWAGGLEWLFQGRVPSRSYWMGLAVALPGVVLLTGTDDAPSSLQGDLLAIVGGVLAAAYLVIGRSVRARVGIGTYACLVCAFAAAFLLPTALLTSTPLVGFPPATWAAMVALALGPQMFGHNGYNYALRYLPAATVASVTLLEPVGATLLAAVFLHEVPGVPALIGAALAVTGVIVAIRR